MKAEQILEELEQTGLVDMETKNNLLTIWFKKFFGTEKEFLFQLNGTSVFGCKSRKTALKKINEFIENGFSLIEAGN